MTATRRSNTLKRKLKKLALPRAFGRT